MLPGLIVTGIGVGLTLPSLAGTAAASLPPTRFATGSAVLTMSRQLGFVLGVALLVAVMGTAGTDFEAGFAFMVVAAALGSVAGFAIAGRAPRPATVPA